VWRGESQTQFSLRNWYIAIYGFDPDKGMWLGNERGAALFIPEDSPVAKQWVRIEQLLKGRN